MPLWVLFCSGGGFLAFLCGMRKSLLLLRRLRSTLERGSRFCGAAAPPHTWRYLSVSGRQHGVPISWVERLNLPDPYPTGYHATSAELCQQSATQENLR